MPSLFRFLFVLAMLAAVAFSGLYILATRFEPKQEMVSKPVTGVKIQESVETGSK